MGLWSSDLIERHPASNPDEPPEYRMIMALAERYGGLGMALHKCPIEALSRQLSDGGELVVLQRDRGNPMCRQDEPVARNAFVPSPRASTVTGCIPPFYRLANRKQVDTSEIAPPLRT